MQTTVTWAAEKRERASLDESDRKWPAWSLLLQRGSAGPYSGGWVPNAGTGMTAGGPTTCKELWGGGGNTALQPEEPELSQGPTDPAISPVQR